MLLVWLGGISPAQVGQAVVIMFAAAAAAGSLGTLIALWREKTFPALALTVLLLVLYLSLVRASRLLPVFQVGSGSDPVSQLSGLPNWLDPFLAMQSVLDPTMAHGQTIPTALGFGLAMLVLTVALNVWGIARLRAWNPSGEPIMQREAPDAAAEEEKDRAASHAAPGLAREVWPNPIVWREIRTRACGNRPFLVKAAYYLCCY